MYACCRSDSEAEAPQQRQQKQKKIPMKKVALLSCKYSCNDVIVHFLLHVSVSDRQSVWQAGRNTKNKKLSSKKQRKVCVDTLSTFRLDLFQLIFNHPGKMRPPVNHCHARPPSLKSEPQR